MVNYFLILLLAHLLADFVFQDETMVESKQSDIKITRNEALIKHSLWFLGTSLVLFIIVEGITWWPSLKIDGLPWTVVFALILLSIIHGLIDLAKVLLSKKTKKHSMILFILDQLVHLGLILGFVGFFKTPEFVKNIKLLLNYMNTETILLFKPTHGQSILLLSCVIIITTSFANIFIKESLASIRSVIDDKEELKIGRYIGGVERIITIAGVVAGEYEAIAALFAAKAAIRFGQAKHDPKFAEYFILGTSTSALMGITIGLLVRKLLTLV